MKYLGRIRVYSTSSTLSGLIKFQTPKEFREACARNVTLAKLKDAYSTQKLEIVDNEEKCTADLNSNRSLPIIEFPKDKIFDEVAKDAKMGEWRKPITKWIRLGKSLLKIYSTGVRSTWNVYWDSKKLIKEYGGYKNLITKMFRTIEFEETEARLNEVNKTEFPITRTVLQECQREKYFWKLPGFFVLWIIFEETVPFICYLMPSVVPWNCLTPGAYKKLSDQRARYEAILPSENKLFSEVPHYQSPYTVDAHYLSSFLKSCKLVPSWKAAIYNWSGNNLQLSEKLTTFHQYLFVDDCLLLRHIMSDHATRLSRRELVNAVLERQLFHRGEDLNAMVRTSSGEKVLVWRLIIYWAFRFDGTITVAGNTLFSEKWGVNNVAILNFPGCEHLLKEDQLKNIQ